MAYLIQRDYAKQIQSENLQQIIGSDIGVLSAAELTALEEAKSYLVQRYDVTQEFKDLFAWDKTRAYSATDRVYLSPEAFSVTTVYTTGQYVTHQNNVYKSKAGSTAHAFNASEWDFVAPQYQVFYAKFPFPEFDYSTQYAVGDKVYWQGRVYTCAIQTQSISHNTKLQYGANEAVPLANIAPDNVNNGLQYWGAGYAYSVPTNTDILNATYWTMGDNRSQQLVTTVLDIALYHVHSRISPRNVPDLRVKRYDDSINWLKRVSRGEVTAMLPVIKPTQGTRIRYGGNIKNQNSY